MLLHGFPSASHQFRELIPLLADRFHVFGYVAPVGFRIAARHPPGILSASPRSSPRTATRTRSAQAAGHFVLETHVAEIATAIGEFLAR
jgi:pimeloyl-ACP methyl ester carboxylesterase